MIPDHLTIRWSGPGMRGDLQANLHHGDAWVARAGPCPGRSSRSRYASSRRPSFSFEDSGAGEAREDAVISNGIA